jgi:hypothetical protein
MGVKPTTLFSSTDEFAMELAELASDVAIDIARGYDWRKLMKLATVPGDAVNIAFSLPTDYDRMPKKAHVHSLSWKTAEFAPVRDLDAWIYLQDNAISGTPGNWIILAGQFQVFPVMPIGETARFYYLSNKIVAGGTKTAFALDADTFDLSERLLTLGLIWRWRSQKRMEYAEDLANYELALSQEIAKDKGSNILTVGRQRVREGSTIAFPGVITP